jgi:hypothetical protein
LFEEDDISINGAMDTILYQVIHCDDKNLLYNCLKNIFDDHKWCEENLDKKLIRRIKQKNYN